MTKQSTVQLAYRRSCLIPCLNTVERIVVGTVGEPVQASEHLHLAEAPPAVGGQTGLGTVAT